MKNHTFLDAVYDELDFKGGSLLRVVDQPSSTIAPDEWLNKGEWLLAGKKAGAEKLFFVGNNPVVVFAKCSAMSQITDCYNRLWSLARKKMNVLRDRKWKSWRANAIREKVV